MLDVENQKTEAIPLAPDRYGTLRVDGTRVTLESVIGAFELGSTPEQIVHKYPTLKLDAVYAVITFYLRHRDEVRSYLEKESKEADSLQEKIEAKFPSDGIRERLLARQAQPGASSP